MSAPSSSARPRVPGPLTLSGSWLPAPADADFDTRRAFAVAHLLSVALAVHALYVPLFAWFGVWPLVLFNVLSTAFSAWSMRQARRGRLRLAVWGSWIEIALHAVLAVELIGWGYGGQYYLLAIIVVAFAFPNPRWQQYAC